MKAALLDMVKSKKFIVACLGVLAVVVGAVLKGLGVEIDTSQIKTALLVVASYLFSQGLADVGKSAAALKAEVDKDE